MDFFFSEAAEFLVHLGVTSRSMWTYRCFLFLYLSWLFFAGRLWRGRISRGRGHVWAKGKRLSCDHLAP